jgi:hypothetical protein
MDIFLRGLLIGFSIAAPVGPIGVLCIRRTLTEGRLAGFLSGMGAASADMLYGAIAAFGLTVVQDLLLGQAVWLRLVGGIFLLYLGVRTFLSKPAERAAQTSRGGSARRLRFDILPDRHQSFDNPVLPIFAGLRLGETNGDSLSAIFAGLVAPRRDKRRLSLCQFHGAGRVPGLGSLVAGAQHGRQFPARKIHPRAAGMGQPAGGGDHICFWLDGAFSVRLDPRTLPAAGRHLGLRKAAFTSPYKRNFPPLTFNHFRWAL